MDFVQSMSENDVKSCTGIKQKVFCDAFFCTLLKNSNILKNFVLI